MHDDEYRKASDCPHTYKPRFAILKAIIDNLFDQTIENTNRVLEADAVFFLVLLVFGLVP